MNRNTFFVLFLLISNLVSGQDLKLWYSQPAQNWSEALPIGNSRLGAMVYGGIEREELQLNEETFWAGSPYNNNNPNAVHVLPVVRKLIFEGRNKEAQRLIDANFLTQQHGMSYLTLGSLYLEFPEHQNGSGFYRDLNLRMQRQLPVIKWMTSLIPAPLLLHLLIMSLLCISKQVKQTH